MHLIRNETDYLVAVEDLIASQIWSVHYSRDGHGAQVTAPARLCLSRPRPRFLDQTLSLP
jgi:hypothetical protein